MSYGHAQLHLQLQALPPPPLHFGSVLFPSHPIQSKRIRNSSFSLRLYHNGSKSSVFGRKSGVIRSSVAEEANGAAEPKPKQQVTVKRPYPFHEIELKWQRYWEENQTFRTPDEIDTSKPKYYVLDMFPYPSGAGLHVGHPLGYTATDILARLKRMQGYNVLHPMGWDAFGLPAEQYAIETGTHPKITTLKNIDRFRSQLKSLGFSYDWDREISTTEPEYYRWTQWIFLQLLKRGLAYQAEVPVNWCPALGTVLANEEVVDGVSERGGHPVIRKPMKQWMLKITAYADRLLEDLDDLDWPESIKEMQRNWIGRSEGAEMDFPVLSSDGQERDTKITIYTTRPDTIFGATYLVVAPEHPFLSSLVSTAQRKSVEEYTDLASRKSDLERTELQKEKTGVFSGCYAKNPVSGEAIPIWVADYVLGSYGTGAIMAVPAHDTRDLEFASKFDIPIRWVVMPDDRNLSGSGKAYSGEGTVVNSSNSTVGLDINGLSSKEAASKVIEWADKTANGKKKVNYKLRDWLFARQRYWGEPIPVVFLDDNGETVPLIEAELPLTLPELDDFSPTGTGEPPLSKSVSWVKTKDPLTGKPARRETSTMPQWAGSCWYYLRFMDPKNSKEVVAKTKEMYWSPVDVYVGGAEHAVLHLLYSRFWHKVLYDIGIVSTKEPFKDSKTWNTSGIEGVHRFLGRTWRLIVGSPLSDGTFKDGTLVTDEDPTLEQLRSLHKCIAKVTEEIEATRFNTGISAMMEFLNVAYKWKKHPRLIIEAFVLLLSPYAPHMAEELWFRLGHSKSLAYEPFPKVDPAFLKESTIVLPVQINGKTRGTIQVEETCSEENAFQLASRDEKLSKYLNGKVIKKRIFVPGKILNVILDLQNVKATV
ncbi:hypothetical protein GBA52_022176 [Prunus armeniaca]|nr:hypothetical protein GBA52_022176 [Prunus armeniaca]